MCERGVGQDRNDRSSNEHKQTDRQTHKARTENPEGTGGRGDVHAEEARDALGLAGLGDLEDVLLAGEGEVDAVDGDGDDGQRRDLLAVNDRLAREGEIEKLEGVW